MMVHAKRDKEIVGGGAESPTNPRKQARQQTRRQADAPAEQVADACGKWLVSRVRSQRLPDSSIVITYTGCT